METGHFPSGDKFHFFANWAHKIHYTGCGNISSVLFTRRLKIKGIYADYQVFAKVFMSALNETGTAYLNCI